MRDICDITAGSQSTSCINFRLFWVQGFGTGFFRFGWVQGCENRLFPVQGLHYTLCYCASIEKLNGNPSCLVTIYARVLRQSESKVSQRITSTDKQIHRGTFQFSQHSNPHCAKQDDTRPTRAASSSSIGTSSLGIL